MKRPVTAIAVRVTGILVGALLLVGAAVGAMLVAFDWRFHPAPKVVRVAPPANHLDAVRQDLTTLAQLVGLDRSFSADATRQFNQERTRLIASGRDLSSQELEMQVSRLVALAGNGHTTVGRRLRRLNRVPIRVAWFAEGLFVVRATDPLRDLVGSRVIAVDGKRPDEVLAALTPYLSGTPEHVAAISPILLESPGALNGMWPQMSANSVTYDLRTDFDQTLTVTLEGVAPDPTSPYGDPSRDIAPQPLTGEKGEWNGVLSGKADLPPVLRNPDASLVSQRMDQGAGLCVHLAKVEADERGPISKQLADLLRPIEPESLRDAILDLRFDGGGDYVEAIRFTKELPKKIASDGKLFILTDHATFSAALVAAARAKYSAGDRAVILGERAGDREQFWAESGTPLELPNSKILVYFATGYHDWNQGCQWKDLGRCFWFNLVFDVPAGSLDPRISIAWRFADYRNGVDTVLAEARRQASELLRKSPARPPLT